MKKYAVKILNFDMIFIWWS